MRYSWCRLTVERAVSRCAGGTWPASAEAPDTSPAGSCPCRRFALPGCTSLTPARISALSSCAAGWGWAPPRRPPVRGCSGSLDLCSPLLRACGAHTGGREGRDVVLRGQVRQPPRVGGKTSGPCALEHQLVHAGSQRWPDRLHFAAENVRAGRGDTAEGLDIGMHVPTAPVPQTA